MRNVDPTLPRYGTDPISLTFGVFEDGVADSDAVGDREYARLLAFAPVFQQHNAVRCERLLYHSIVQELPGVFHRNATRKSFFILEPKHAQRSSADVKACLALLFVSQ